MNALLKLCIVLIVLMGLNAMVLSENDEPASERPPTMQRDWKEPPPNSEQTEDDGGQTPEGIMDATKGLMSRMRKTTSRRGADLLNGTSGAVRLSGGYASNLANLVRKQTNNSRTVANKAFGMANGFGDAVTRGTVKTMQAGGELGSEVASQSGGVLDAAKKTGLKLTRTGGSAAKLPLTMGGDALDVTKGALALPKVASKRIANTFTKTLLPMFGVNDSNDSSSANEEEAASKKSKSGKK